MPLVEKEVRTFIIDNFLFGDNSSQFSDSDSFLENGLIDSMGILMLVEFVKEKYAISVEDEAIIPENWDSVDRVARFVEGKLSAKV